MAKQPNDGFPGCFPLFGDLYIEFGTGSYSTTDSEATVRTQIDEIVYGQAGVNDTFSPATDAGVMDTLHVGTSVSSGTVTITRSSTVRVGDKVRVIWASPRRRTRMSDDDSSCWTSLENRVASSTKR